MMFKMKIEIRYYLETEEEKELFENMQLKDNLEAMKRNQYAKICLLRYIKNNSNKIKTN